VFRGGQIGLVVFGLQLVHEVPSLLIQQSTYTQVLFYFLLLVYYSLCIGVRVSFLHYFYIQRRQWPHQRLTDSKPKQLG